MVGFRHFLKKNALSKNKMFFSSMILGTAYYFSHDFQNNSLDTEMET